MKFMLFFKGGTPGPQGSEQYTRAWQRWMDDLRKRNVVESGAQYGEGGKFITQKGVSDWMPSGNDLTGFMVVNVSSEQEAIDLAKQAPHIALGGSTVIRPCRVAEPAMTR